MTLHLKDHLTGFKIKSFLHSLPTGDLQQIYYSGLFPQQTIMCTNNHILFLSHTHLSLYNQDSKRYLIDKLYAGDAILQSDIPGFVNNLSIFTQVRDHHHASYLLFHQVVPMELSNIIRIFISSKSLRASIMSDFLQYFFDFITHPFWKLHASAFVNWERQRGITKHKKRFYYKHHRRHVNSTSNAFNTPHSQVDPAF